nr:hypothetical protein [Tanacetum cinerariifolium]
MEEIVGPSAALWVLFKLVSWLVARYWKNKAAAAVQSDTAAGQLGTTAGGLNGNNFLGGFQKVADSYVRESYTREEFRKK